MPILPEEVATATFTRVHRQGYHTGEVDAFLRSVAADYGAALEKMLLTPAETTDLDVGEEVNAILRAARESASTLLQRARDEADALQRAATEKAQEIETQASQARVAAFEQSVREAQEVKSQAEWYAQDLRSRVEAETRQMVETAEARAQELHAYNEKLSEHLGLIERLVNQLRGEIDAPAQAWPGGQAQEDFAPQEESDGDGQVVETPERFLESRTVTT
jgi:DivIVA domain-containing protein